MKFLNLFFIYNGTCLIRHTKEPGKCVRLYRMSEYSGFILVKINTLGPKIFVRCQKTQVSDCTSPTVVLNNQRLSRACIVHLVIKKPIGPM